MAPKSKDNVSRLQAAVYRYSLTLAVYEEDSSCRDHVRRELHRNRSAAYILLERYKDALADACASMIPGTNLSEVDKMLNQKSMLRAAQAEYGLGLYDDAARRFASAVKMAADAAEMCREGLTRALARMQERDRGKYDLIHLNAMYRSATEGHRVLDHASFIKKTTVAPAGHRGRGLFATEDVKHGHVVMVEKAFCVEWEPDLDGFEKITNMSEDKLRTTTPDVMASFLDLEAGSFEGNPSCMLGDDVFINSHQIESIIRRNSFDCEKVKSIALTGSLRHSTEPDPKPEHPTPKGMWIQASYANHSCLANAHYAFIGDMMILRAARDIAAGDEILINYVSAAQSYPQKFLKLNLTYGFQCECALCAVEAQVSPAVFVERDRLEREADAFLSSQPGPNDLSRARAEELHARKKATYDNTLYGCLPRLASLELQRWLAHDERNGPGPALDEDEKALCLLQDCGYIISVQDEGVQINRHYAVPLAQAVDAALLLAEMMGVTEVRKTFKDLAEEIYVLLNGVPEGFSEW